MAKTKIEIKSYFGKLLFEYEAKDNSIKKTLNKAVLRGAVLSRADLRGAVLSRADLSGADLSGADLSGADLRGAVLRGADLRGAYLSGADLRGADLRGADLRGADLRGADLGRAKELPAAWLIMCRDDLWAILSSAPKEAEALRNALISGKVNGSTYEGACACLIGTIANARGCNYSEIPNLIPDSSRPAEQYFLSIGTGDTPDKNPMCKRAVEWINEWLENMRLAFSSKLVVEK